MDPNHIPAEMGNGGFNSGMRFQDMLSTWLDMEDCYNPAFSDEILPDLHLLDDNFFQFGTAEGGDPTSGLSVPDFGTETFLLDHFNSDPCIDKVSLLLDTTVDTSHHDDDSGVTFPSDDEMFPYYATNDLGHDKTVAIDGHPMATIESISMVSPTSTSTTTTTTTTTTSASSEIVFNDLTPSLNVSIHVGSPALASGDEDEVEDHVERSSCVTKLTAMNSKNLVSERNRRKRLSQQLLALRALVPNITKMDKRSVLVDALAYLRRIHEEIALIQEELNRPNNVQTSLQNSPRAGCHRSSCRVAPGSIPRTKGHEIVQIETEKMEDKRFIVKMTCKGGPAVGGDVVQVIEDLGLEITHIALEQMKPQLYITTVFIKVRKHGKMTEEKLKDCITSTALRSGLSFKNA